MILRLTAEAERDLQSIHDFIAVDSLTAAKSVANRILSSLSILEASPKAGRPGRIEDTREWSINGLPYVAVYRLADPDDLYVIAIIHTARRWP